MEERYLDPVSGMQAPSRAVVAGGVIDRALSEGQRSAWADQPTPVRPATPLLTASARLGPAADMASEPSWSRAVRPPVGHASILPRPVLLRMENRYGDRNQTCGMTARPPRTYDTFGIFGTALQEKIGFFHSTL
jgi:hypothetical protein